MESEVQNQRPEGQQVMIAQVRGATPPEPRPLEGETHGPDYQGGPQLQTSMLNGIPPRLPGASPAGSGGIESLPYSPAADRTEPMGQPPRAVAPQGSPQAFFSKPWPAQPERSGMVGPGESPGSMRGFGGASTATLNWMARLGDFVRAQVQGGMETRTTMTSRQVMGASGIGGVVVQREQVQHMTSRPASPHHAPTYASASQSAPGDGAMLGSSESDPPLFGAGARRVMESWAHRAPLLHGGQPTQQGPGTDPGSTGSIPREVVQEEVRRQVQEALDGQRRSLELLQEENRLLRLEMRGREAPRGWPDEGLAGVHVPGELRAASMRDVPEGLRAASMRDVPEGPRAASMREVPEGPRAAPMRDVPEGLRAASMRDVPEGPRAASMREVPEGPRAASMREVLEGPRAAPMRGVPEGLRAVSMHGVPEGHQHVASQSHGVPEGHQQYASQSRGVPEGHQYAASQSRGVPEGHQYAASQSRGVPEGHQYAASQSRGVPEGHQDTASQSRGVPEGHQDIASQSRGVPEGHLGAFFKSRDGANIGESIPSPERGRTSSLDRRTSPLGRSRQRPSASPTGLRGGLGRASFAYGIGGLLDGDGYSFPQNERAYRQPLYQETTTFGDYDVSAPPGLDPAPSPSAKAPMTLASPQSAPQATRGSVEKEPTPIEVLITGMSQLQQLLLKKGDGLELDAKGVPELPKLAEYSPETGAIDFQDYLYLVEQQIGSLASGAGEWWQKTLGVAQAAYSEYQSLSPVKRLGVKALLTPELKEDRYKRLEKKVAAMLLASLPKGVKDDLIAYRVQGVHQILYRLLVIFQPGGAQDRAQLLRQLDVSESAAGPGEAVTAIRRWYRLLQRASDLGVTLPDESIQVKSLNAIVKKTSEQNGDFKFRLALARTELQIDTRPNQVNVLKYMQHLLAELEQLGSVIRRPPAATSTPSTAAATPAAITSQASGTTTSLKGLQGADQAPKGSGKTKAPPPKKNCQWFGTDNGCRSGKDCTFQHSWQGLTRSERCILCGSKQHRAKECAAGKSGSSPERGSGSHAAKAPGGAPTPSASLASAGAREPAGATEGTSTSTPTTSAANKIDAAQMSEILVETNKMLKALTAEREAPTASSSSDPLAVIQKQLDEVRRLKALRVPVPTDDSCSFESAVAWYDARLHATSLCSSSASPPGEEVEALLDSGASHPFRPPNSEEELRRARRVNVSLATGEGALLPQTTEGTLLSEGVEGAPIMGQLVQLLGCQIRWTQSRLTVIHPVHGRLKVRLRGSCPVLPVSQALTLIGELEQARVKEFQQTVDNLQAQVRALREQGTESWNWQRHLRALCEEGRRTSMAGFLHRCPTFASVTPETLLEFQRMFLVMRRMGGSCSRECHGRGRSAR